MTAGIGSQLRKGVVEPCVLGLLATERMYGWQLSEVLIEHGMIASIGTLYPILSRLRAQGLVVVSEEASDAGPVRKYYELSAGGTRELQEFRKQWASFAPTVEQLVGEAKS